ncbi:hypothetical protein JW766_05050 [Candidatus Dojkabacteria bacterium]|nr:hypothetical protein [Candidatus Dojkabacteria bacterium]
MDKKYRRSLLKPRFLTVFLAVVVLFNFFSTKILPKEVFLAYAADINIQELVDLANSERQARGVQLLSVDSRLVEAAKAKGEDMLAKDYWSHYGPNGESPWDFILSSGYEYMYAGENLAKDFSSTAPIHSAWMASQSHRSNILNVNFKNVGIAAVTGEFQGEETTIVVQMFGAGEVDYNESSVNDSDSLPVTGSEGSLESPVIIYPHDGDIFDNGAFDIRGNSNEGTKIEIFDNHNISGEVAPFDSAFVYTNAAGYSDGLHIIYAKAINEAFESSGISNIINVNVDTIDPNIVRESAKFEYVEVGYDFRNFVFSIEIEDNPIYVSGEYKGEDVDCNYINERWQCVVNEKMEVFEELKIYAKDAAGNETMELFKTEELNSLAEFHLGDMNLGSEIHTWFIENFISRIFTRSLRGKVNFLFAVIIVIILGAQYLVLAKTGLTKEYSFSLLHLPVFAILLFVGLLGSGGEIL